MLDFDTLLEGSAKAHGHLCPGQVIGVRMAMLGCRLIGLDDPSSREQIKKLVVYAEIDRCATDAVAHVTGVKLGRRSLKFIDNGIMACTFVNLSSGTAFRIASREDAREKVARYAPGVTDPRAQQLAAYRTMPEDRLFTVQAVRVDIPVSDLPGPTRFKATCHGCGTVVRDKKEIFRNGKILCRSCAFGAYYVPAIDKEKIRLAKRG
jgi:formylmethanofuran dehydrogenase subunit E